MSHRNCAVIIAIYIHHHHHHHISLSMRVCPNSVYIKYRINAKERKINKIHWMTFSDKKKHANSLSPHTNDDESPKCRKCLDIIILEWSFFYFKHNFTLWIFNDVSFKHIIIIKHSKVKEFVFSTSEAVCQMAIERKNKNSARKRERDQMIILFERFVRLFAC